MESLENFHILFCFLWEHFEGVNMEANNFGISFDFRLIHLIIAKDGNLQ
jgi:hypothetical protein